MALLWRMSYYTPGPEFEDNRYGRETGMRLLARTAIGMTSCSGIESIITVECRVQCVIPAM